MTSLLQRGCVKSIQRGHKFVSRNEFTKQEITQVTINISPIDPNKSLLLFDVYLGGSGTGNSMNNSRFMTTDLLQASIVITNTSDKVYTPSSGNGNIIGFALSYQVVEFY